MYSNVQDGGMSPGEDGDTRVNFKEVIRKLSEKEDESIAHRLQDEEYNKNKARNVANRQVLREDIKVAKRTQSEEEQFQQQEQERRTLLAVQEETDKLEAKKLQEKEDARRRRQLEEREEADRLEARRIQEEEDARRRLRGEERARADEAAAIELAQYERLQRERLERERADQAAILRLLQKEADNGEDQCDSGRNHTAVKTLSYERDSEATYAVPVKRKPADRQTSNRTNRETLANLEGLRVDSANISLEERRELQRRADEEFAATLQRLEIERQGAAPLKLASQYRPDY